MMTRLFILLFLITWADPVLSQPRVNIPAIEARYSQYNAVALRMSTNYVFDIVSDTLLVTQEEGKEVLMLNDLSKAFTNDYINYSGSFTRIENIQAFTLVPGNRGYQKIMASGFKESHDMDNHVFYDDSKTIQFSYPSLTKGAITSLDYSVVYLNPRFLRGSYFQTIIPVLESKVTVKVHKNIKIGYKLFQADSIDLESRQYSRGNYHFYEWTVRDIQPYQYLTSKHFSVRHFSPHIVFYVEEVRLKNRLDRYYSTVDDLYRFYQELISGMNNDSNADLETLVEALTHNHSDWEKARNIYYWVQNNIKYVAYSEGYMGFIPVSPVEVFSKRYGDCKGMSSLIRKMMELAGLNCYFAWVGTRGIPYHYEELPLPAVDNHMVVAFPWSDSILIIDGTYNHIDFGMHPYGIQGKELLIALDPQRHRTYQVPVTSSSLSTVYDSLSISLSGQRITGNGTRIHTGFNKMELAYALEGVKPDEVQKRLSSLFEKGNNKFRIENHQKSGLFERDVPSEVLYDFILDDYANAGGNEVFINLNLDKSFQNLKVDTTRRHSPLLNDFRYIETHITRFRIPEKYELTYIPGNDEILTDDFRITFQYRVEKDYIILEKEMIFDFLILLNGQIHTWNKAMDQLNRNYRQSVVLRKINN